ncbi:MAG: T9SS type A sorting domain-containing protein [Bacteroidetes bacterium]|nr:T9SS type A sorting domain-containing protein [Bacteroidota bacterium]MBU1719257.1 T9SS type A sorting domain-containing protein [Bacteroidota bacterium]
MICKHLTAFFFLLGFLQVNGQRIVTFEIQLPDTMYLDAGINLTVSTGNSAVLGSDMVLAGGEMPYSFAWTPGIFLNDSMTENPVCTPLATVIYQLQVTDLHGCIITDSVTVTLDTSGTGISDFAGSSPMPAVLCDIQSRQIQVKCEFTKTMLQMNVSLVDISGRICFSSDFDADERDVSIPFPKTPGIYLLRISGQNYQTAFKLDLP